MVVITRLSFFRYFNLLLLENAAFANQIYIFKDEEISYFVFTKVIETTNQREKNMNTNHPKSSNDSNQPPEKPPEKQSKELFLPTSPPLSSPNEPTSAYPSDPSRNYSSDPSQYSYPQKPAPVEPSKVYTTEPLDTARIAGDEMRSSERLSQKEREGQKAYQGAHEEKTRETFGTKGDSKKIDELYHYASSNKEQTITYILLIFGLLFMLFFNNLLGGLMIGMVAGYYFSSEIIYYIRNIGQTIGGQDQLRYVVLTVLLLGLFIAAPGIFIGAAIVAAFKQIFLGPRDPSN